ncbi:Uncharacterised protein [Vibrio cholerae]|nr:Uncharacterised protein [Vibrio cholerae]
MLPQQHMFNGLNLLSGQYAVHTRFVIMITGQPITRFF